MLIVSTTGSPMTNPLTGLLQAHISLMFIYVQDSMNFVNKSKNVEVRPDDILVSFDIKPLYNMVLL